MIRWANELNNQVKQYFQAITDIFICIIFSPIALISLMISLPLISRSACREYKRAGTNDPPVPFFNAV